MSGCENATDVPPVLVYSDDGQYLPPAPGPGVVPDRENSPIPDVPLPIGFKVVPANCSLSVGTNGVRTVYHYYQGRAPAEDVQLMYRRNLPHDGWTFTGTQPGVGEHETLLFTKGPERLSIATTHDNSLTTIVVEVMPR